MLRILLITTIFFLSGSSVSFGALIKSTGNGNWNAAGTWDLGRIPADGDEIVIDAGDIVTIPFGVNISRNNVTIAIRGVLSIPFGGLTLDANSLVVVENGGSITGLLSIINVGGTIIPIIFGTPPGPSFIDTGGLQSGTPPDYIPLPIELLSFNAKISGESVEISWATAAEIDNDYFTLEQSEDGVNWNTIGEEAGAGNSTVRLDYFFVDYNPIPGLSYYRLKQTDYDGQFEYFDPIVILYETDNLFKIFPNPTTDILQLSTSGELANALIFIKNLNGQPQDFNIDASTHQATIDVSGLSSGVYLLEIIFPESVLTKRIVKK